MQRMQSLRLFCHNPSRDTHHLLGTTLTPYDLNVILTYQTEVCLGKWHTWGWEGKHHFCDSYSQIMSPSDILISCVQLFGEVYSLGCSYGSHWWFGLEKPLRSLEHFYRGFPEVKRYYNQYLVKTIWFKAVLCFVAAVQALNTWTCCICWGWRVTKWQFWFLPC